MLTITIPGLESFDDEKQIFVNTEDCVIELEHSLVSISKWESKWEKPFLTDDPKTSEQVYSYIEMMSQRGEIPQEVLFRLTEENLKQINQYIEARMTATWFREARESPFKTMEIVTSEVIYHWIVALQIDWEAQNWHLNRLITLVKTINEKNKSASDTKSKAPTSNDLANRRSLMEQRRAEAENKV